MHWPTEIIEKEHLEEYLSEECFLYPVLSDPNGHYVENRISFLYGFTIGSKREFLVGFYHYDIPKSRFDIGEIRTNKRHIIYKKKYLPFYTDCTDIQLLQWLANEPLEPIPKSIEFFQRRYHSNDIIPIFKWIEYIRHIREVALKTHPPPPRTLLSYENFLNQLIKIEHAGLYFDNVSCNINQRGDFKGLKFTEYNICTTTGRPSNSFDGINYAALNKSDGTRKAITSRFPNGLLIEYDYKAFHVSLIAKLINYKFSNDPYTALASEFFQTNEPSLEQIQESKKMTFRQIYGGISAQYKKNEFFSKLAQYLEKIETENRYERIHSVLFNKKIPSTDNHIVAFNHILQNLETEINSITMTRINRFLEDFKSQMILYTYDSFLIDFSPTDGKSVLIEIKNIVDSIGIPSRMKVGRNYNEMHEMIL